MGASGWDYIESFDTDLATTLTNLRGRVFDEGDYFWLDSIARPGTLAELDGLFDEINGMSPDEVDFEDPRIVELADIASSGTHSVLDARAVGGRRGDIRVLPSAEVEALFGSPQPGRADFERVPEEKRITVLGASLGACVQLHDDRGGVSEVAFWGISGD